MDNEYQAKREKLYQRFYWVNTKMEEYEEKFVKKFCNELLTFVDDSKNTINCRIDQGLTAINARMSESQEFYQDTQARMSHMATGLQQSAHRIDNMEQETIPTARTLKTVTGQLKHLLKDYQTRVEVMDATVDFLRNELTTVKQD